MVPIYPDTDVGYAGLPFILAVVIYCLWWVRRRYLARTNKFWLRKEFPLAKIYVDSTYFSKDDFASREEREEAIVEQYCTATHSIPMPTISSDHLECAPGRVILMDARLHPIETTEFERILWNATNPIVLKCLMPDQIGRAHV